MKLSSPGIEKSLSYKPLSVSTWESLLKLFGDRGACGGCWCMTWRLQNKEYEKNKGANNRELLYQLVKGEEPLGMIAFDDAEPIGWCSVSPREKLCKLETSRILKKIDSRPVWSITCIFIKRQYRKRGISPLLITETSAYAFSHGAKIIEAYPLVSESNRMIPDLFAYYGLSNSFKKAGFKKVKQASEKRLIMRLMQ
jgi:ribosomal protein S18 acetylase RimI-like enzyme